MQEDVVGGPREKAGEGIPQSILCDNSRTLNSLAFLINQQSVTLKAVHKYNHSNTRPYNLHIGTCIPLLRSGGFQSTVIEVWCTDVACNSMAADSTPLTGKNSGNVVVCILRAVLLSPTLPPLPMAATWITNSVLFCGLLRTAFMPTTFIYLSRSVCTAPKKV